MASKSVLELAVGTGKWDSGLKKAKATLDKFTEANGGLSKALQTDADKIQKFVGMMGKMESTAKTAKGQMNDYKSTIEQLTMQYNRMSEAQKKTIGQDYLKSIDQIKQKYQSVNEEVKAINRSLQNAPSMGNSKGFLDGFSSKMGGAIQVFAGNMMTKATMALADLGNEMQEMVKHGIELAKQGEGIRIAFQRLGRGDILDGLRQATHGTVTDLELMKAAVKFNDFRLPLNELGTMLAFAQQKAKDTGQSVDYMVDSIVTGLGRKSLMILDNLGLSASEIRERMKETGDMTTAVGAIIREQMQKAGDYVETAADRAAQANVNLENKLEELGRKFAPIEEASTQLWTSMKIAILDVVSGPLARLLNGLTEAGRLRNQMNDMAGGDSNTETDKQIGFLQKTSPRNRRKRYEKQIAIYEEQEALERQRTDRARRNLASLKNAKPGTYDAETYAALKKQYKSEIAGATQKANAWQMFRLNYQQRAQGLLTSNKPLPPVKPDPVIPTKTGSGGNTTVKDLTEEQKLQQQINDLVQQGMTMDEQGRAAQRVKIAALQDQLDAYKQIENELRGITKQEAKPELSNTDKFKAGAMNMDTLGAFTSGLKGELRNADLGSELYNSLNSKIADASLVSNMLTEAMTSGVQGANLEKVSQELKDKLLAGSTFNAESIQAMLNQINQYITDSGFKLVFDVETGKIKKQMDDVTTDIMKQKEAWNKTGQAMGVVSQAFNAIQDPAAKIMGTVAQAIANVALAYSDAMAKDQTTKFNLFAFIAAASAATIGMISTIASIHSATGYAEGGMIKGNTYSGDQIMANGGAIGLNAGELVLNKAQQFNLASQLEGDGNQSTTPSRPYVSGEQIYLGLNNYLRRSGRGEIITSR